MISEDKRNEIIFALSTGQSVKQVCTIYGIGKTLAYELKNRVKNNVNTSGNVVGVFGCTHFPYVREGYLEWVRDTFTKAGVTQVVHLGDMVDNHNWSRHATEPDAESGLSEFDRANECVKQMKDMFSHWPITWCLGNHDRIPERQIKSLGLPSMLLKSNAELWDVPDWHICKSVVIDGVKYTHGINTKSTLLTAQRLRQSFVSTHYHSVADIATHASWNDRVFGMHVGSGMDDKAYVARYAEESLAKSIIACGTVRDGKYPQLHYMDL